MSTRSEFTHNGVLTHVVEDNGDGTGNLTLYAPDGTVTSTEALDGLPVVAPSPLDPVGALATLLVVHDLLGLTEAAAVAQREPNELVNEALAWAVGG